MSPQSSRYVRKKGAAPLSGAEEQAERAISAYAHLPAYFSLKIGIILLGAWASADDRI
jgi:hypothetical protein